MKRIFNTSLLAASLFVATAVHADSDRGHGRSHRAEIGAVYTMDNSPSGNNVWAFGRRPNGTLTGPTVIPTHGLGTGDGLGNQGAVQLSRDGHWLFVCNAGSDEISLFRVTRRGLRLADKVSAEGQRPVSLALHGNLLYVLNAGGAEPGGVDSITGFLFAFGRLIPLPDASYSLSADATGPAEIAFTRDGEDLIVTEKGTDTIDVFQVGCDGLVSGSQSFASPVPTPFGFASGRRSRIYVTEANGGAANPGASSVSSYQVTDDGELEIISAGVPTGQTAACWLILSRNERFAYTANTPANSISSFLVGRDGELTLLESEAANTGDGTGPVDMSLSHDGRFLYSLNSANGSIGAFAVSPGKGTLRPLSGAGALPLTANGLAAR